MRPTEAENVGREHFPVQTDSRTDRQENVPVVRFTFQQRTRPDEAVAENCDEKIRRKSVTKQSKIRIY